MVTDCTKTNVLTKDKKNPTKSTKIDMGLVGSCPTPPLRLLHLQQAVAGISAFHKMSSILTIVGKKYIYMFYISCQSQSMFLIWKCALTIKQQRIYIIFTFLKQQGKGREKPAVKSYLRKTKIVSC